MPRLRLFLAWLLLVAVPLQGFAAASTLLCGPSQRASMAAGAAGHPLPMDHAPAARAHHAHGDPAHAHAGHAAHHATADHAHADDHHALHHPNPGGDEAPAQAADNAHACPACAASCHAVALTGDPGPVALPLPPHIPSAEPFVRYDSQPPPVPDKPPRA